MTPNIDFEVWTHAAPLSTRNRMTPFYLYAAEGVGMAAVSVSGLRDWVDDAGAFRVARDADEAAKAADALRNFPAATECRAATSDEWPTSPKRSTAEWVNVCQSCQLPMVSCSAFNCEMSSVASGDLGANSAAERERLMGMRESCRVDSVSDFLVLMLVSLVLTARRSRARATATGLQSSLNSVSLEARFSRFSISRIACLVSALRSFFSCFARSSSRPCISWVLRRGSCGTLRLRRAESCTSTLRTLPARLRIPSRSLTSFFCFRFGS